MIKLPTQQPSVSKKPALVAYVQWFELAVALVLALWQHPEISVYSSVNSMFTITLSM